MFILECSFKWSNWIEKKLMFHFENIFHIPAYSLLFPLRGKRPCLWMMWWIISSHLSISKTIESVYLPRGDETNIFLEAKNKSVMSINECLFISWKMLFPRILESKMANVCQTNKQTLGARVELRNSKNSNKYGKINTTTICTSSKFVLKQLKKSPKRHHHFLFVILVFVSEGIFKWNDINGKPHHILCIYTRIYID